MFKHRIEDFGASGNACRILVAEWETENDLTPQEAREQCNSEARHDRIVVLSTLQDGQWIGRNAVGFSDNIQNIPDHYSGDWRKIR